MIATGIGTEVIRLGSSFVSEALPADSLSICLFSDVALPSVGGAQTVLDELAGRYQSLGHRPVVLAPLPRQPWDDSQLSYPVIRHRRLISKRYAVRLLLPRMISLHVMHRFDVIHCHAAYPQAYVARDLSRIFNVPYVVRPHGADILPGDSICRHPKLAQRVRSALVDADAVVAQGESMRQVIQSFAVSKNRIVTINNGVNVGRSSHAPPFDHPRPYALAMTSLVPHKGIDLLLQAWARSSVPSSLDLLIAGAGPERGKLEQLAFDLGLSDRVRWLGLIGGSVKDSLLRSAQFFIATPRREPFSNAILEALAAGLPVVATAVDGNKEIVHHNINGLLCEDESLEDIAEAIRLLSTHDTLRQLLAAGASKLAENYNWDNVVCQYLDVYRRAIQARTSIT